MKFAIGHKTKKILHTVDFIRAPQNNSTYILRSQKSLEHTFSHWQRHSWNEKDYLAIIALKDWHVPHGERLLEMGAWAFVSDIIRMYALYTEGGLYADWDVEFVSCIPESFLELPLVFGFEPYTHAGRGTQQVGLQVCLSRMGQQFWHDLFTQYVAAMWTTEFDILPGICTRLLEQKYGLQKPRSANIYYYLKNGVCILPYDVFYPFMGTRVFIDNPQLTESLLYNTIKPSTIALHWEHSQMQNEAKEKQGWTKYLELLR